jgi:hypothetical protein
MDTEGEFVVNKGQELYLNDRLAFVRILFRKVVGAFGYNSPPIERGRL